MSPRYDNCKTGIQTFDLIKNISESKLKMETLPEDTDRKAIAHEITLGICNLYGGRTIYMATKPGLVKLFKDAEFSWDLLEKCSPSLKWPSIVKNIGQMIFTLLKNKHDFSKTKSNYFAKQIVLEIAHRGEGRGLYIPKGSAMKTEQRNRSIHRKHTSGVGIGELAQQYNLSEQQTYKIIRQKNRLSNDRI